MTAAPTDAPPLGFWKIAETFPDHLALVDPDEREISAGELVASCNQLVHGLRAMGLEPGDAIAMLLPNSAEVFELYLAVGQADHGHVAGLQLGDHPAGGGDRDQVVAARGQVAAGADDQAARGQAAPGGGEGFAFFGQQHGRAPFVRTENMSACSCSCASHGPGLPRRCQGRRAGPSARDEGNPFAAGRPAPVTSPHEQRHRTHGPRAHRRIAVRPGRDPGP